MTIQKDKVVTMHYHLTNSDDGQVLDSSRGNQPLTYLHGTGSLIPGLERELAGLDVGATKTVQVGAADAYGEYDDEMVQTLPRSEFAGIDHLEVGMRLQAQNQDGNTFTVHIAQIEGDQVMIDGNHPLAGMPLTFEIEIVAIRDATTEELQHGHAHGEGGHHHH
ncbi:FKBP-type peptidyl-prolyl cis-trans isomerase [Candidatus Entotheonella palauensis]|nr:peptidylprolyl isomerase [Candidatus Entotheonella palauensis]